MPSSETEQSLIKDIHCPCVQAEATEARLDRKQGKAPRVREKTSMGFQHLTGGKRKAHQILHTRVLEEKILVSLARAAAMEGTLGLGVF